MLLEPVHGVRVICVDPSTRSCGVVVTSPTHPHKLEWAVTIDPFTRDPDQICQEVIKCWSLDKAPTWLVIEDPGHGGPRARPDVILGIGQAIGIWRHAWMVNDGPDSRVLLVRQVTWCAGMMPDLIQAKRAERQAESLRTAKLIWGSGYIGTPTLGVRSDSIKWTEDLADAAMMASFIRRWPEFVDQIGALDRKRVTTPREVEGGL